MSFWLCLVLGFAVVPSGERMPIDPDEMKCMGDVDCGHGECWVGRCQQGRCIGIYNCV